MKPQLFSDTILLLNLLVLIPANNFIWAFLATSCDNTKNAFFTIQRDMSISKWIDEYSFNNNDDNSGISKVEGEAVVRRITKKNRSSSKEPHDNRDALPFLVRVQTPDPYTRPDEMLRQAKRNSELVANKRKSSNSKTDEGGTRGKTSSRNTFTGKYARYSNNLIASSIYSRNAAGSLYKILGQFELDKNTNCGDLIEVGDRAFEVITARSQFKYAGGKRFVMVRKILEVKEINRIAEEACLTRVMRKSSADFPLPKLE